MPALVTGLENPVPTKLPTRSTSWPMDRDGVTALRGFEMVAASGEVAREVFPGIADRAFAQPALVDAQDEFQPRLQQHHPEIDGPQDGQQLPVASADRLGPICTRRRCRSTGTNRQRGHQPSQHADDDLVPALIRQT